MGGRVDMKVVLLGKEYGGKTSLVERYLHNIFTGDVPYQSVSSPIKAQIRKPVFKLSGEKKKRRYAVWQKENFYLCLKKLKKNENYPVKQILCFKIVVSQTSELVFTFCMTDFRQLVQLLVPRKLK